jgi:hypothetical protein
MCVEGARTCTANTNIPTNNIVYLNRSLPINNYLFNQCTLRAKACPNRFPTRPSTEPLTTLLLRNCDALEEQQTRRASPAHMAIDTLWSTTGATRQPNTTATTTKNVNTAATMRMDDLGSVTWFITSALAPPSSSQGPSSSSSFLAHSQQLHEDTANSKILRTNIPIQDQIKDQRDPRARRTKQSITQAIRRTHSAEEVSVPLACAPARQHGIKCFSSG